MEIWSSQYAVMMEVIAQTGVAPEEIAAIGITNQRETTILWDRATGRPIYNAIVWQCRRTAQIVRRAAGTTGWRTISARTPAWCPTPISPPPRSSGSWTMWRGPGRRRRRGELLFGTVDTWLLWKLTGGEVHVTDYTNASRTMLFDIHTL